MVAFVGASVTAIDMLRRWESAVGPVGEREAALDQLEDYVRWVAGQKLGRVFEAAYDSAGLLNARKVSDSAPMDRVPIPE